MGQLVLLKHSKLCGGTLLLVKDNLPGTGKTILEKTKGFFRRIAYSKLGSRVKDLLILHVLGNFSGLDVPKKDLSSFTSEPGWCLLLLWRHAVGGVCWLSCVVCEW